MHEGELVICGRLKELIIIRGRNLHPQDIELTCRQTHPPLAGLAAAAFSVERDEEERLVVVQGIDDATSARIGDLEELAAELARAITSTHEVDVHAVLLVPLAEVPKTASGKVRRTACRTAYDAGQLQPLAATYGRSPASASQADGPALTISKDLLERAHAAAAPERPTVIAEWLGEYVGAAIGTPDARVAKDRTLLQLGLDSLRVMELRSALHNELGVLLPLSDVGADTVAGLAGQLAERLPESRWELPNEPAPVLAGDPEACHEPFPLTDLQQAYLVGRGGEFPLGGVGTHFFAEFDGEGLDTARLRTALDRMVERHGMLRAVVSADGTQRVLPFDPTRRTPVTEYDLRGAGAEKIRAHLE
ncbi:MAG: phosphopantetheine-binding protein, partial [Nocardioidaceae bacterium]